MFKKLIFASLAVAMSAVSLGAANADMMDKKMMMHHHSSMMMHKKMMMMHHKKMMMMHKKMMMDKPMDKPM